MSSDLAGLLMGLGSALGASLSYLCSRHYYAATNRGAWSLFGMAHLQMGVFAVLLLPFVVGGNLGPLRTWLPALSGCAIFYLAAQCLLFQALREADASQVAPLIGLKIPVLALASPWILGLAVTPGGWVAVGLCVAAGFLISPPKRLTHLRPLLLMLLTCCGYAASDLCIGALIRELRQGGAAMPALLAVTFSYILTGVIGAGVVLGRREMTGWSRQLHALPFSVTWFSSMILLFLCFARIGVVYGAMAQSVRGILNVIIGAVIARLGWQHLDNLRSNRLLLQRGAGALLMTLAILLYQYTRVA